MKQASSIDSFCRDHEISRGMYYKLKQQGQAPREMRVGKKPLISAEAAAEWRRAREEDSAA